MASSNSTPTPPRNSSPTVASSASSTSSSSTVRSPSSGRGMISSPLASPPITTAERSSPGLPSASPPPVPPPSTRPRGHSTSTVLPSAQRDRSDSSASISAHSFHFDITATTPGASVLDLSLSSTFRGRSTSVCIDLLEFAPIPGLAPAAKLLLGIWDSLQLVDTNRLACLSLTERCADILLSVRVEINEAGDEVTEELAKPIQRLWEAFFSVSGLMQKQINRPFLKRYLKRDEIIKEIAACDAALTDALGMFGLSIQIRILKQVQAYEAKRERDTKEVLQRLELTHRQQHTRTDALGITFGDPSAGQEAKTLGIEKDEDVFKQLKHMREKQNEEAMKGDWSDLRGLMRAALDTSSDQDMIKALQVGREEMPEAIKTMQRALEAVLENEKTVSSGSFSSSDGEFEVITPVSSPSTTPAAAIVKRGAKLTQQTESIGKRPGTAESTKVAKDTLDREFIESGIDALRRMRTLPSWTITRYEVDREQKIGVGFFSDVYKGVWHGKTVAIKVLAETTPRNLFVREVSIWKTLRHRNVLELYGASSATGDPPWFFVSPYLKRGSLSQFLRHQAMLAESTPEGQEKIDLLRYMHEIAKGMHYLHQNGVLHGDLKAANVLVDDKLHCVISDFGQSEMKSEAYRLSGTTPPHGTLRWQAPELMKGASQLTSQVDVYAFSMTCIEVLGMGKMFWPLHDDNDVRRFVLLDRSRPPIPSCDWNSQTLDDIIKRGWDDNPDSRPAFSKIVDSLKQCRLVAGGASEPLEDNVPSPRLDWEQEPHASPDMRPVAIPSKSPGKEAATGSSPRSEGSWFTARDDPPSPFSTMSSSHLENTVRSSLNRQSEAVVFTTSRPPSQGSSLFTSSSTDDDSSGGGSGGWGHNEGYDSPPPDDGILDLKKNEMRYRMHLHHDEFHPSLTLPLWAPEHLPLGTVGYLRKPSGAFIPLMNALFPSKSKEASIKTLPSVHGYGTVNSEGRQRVDKRNMALRGLDAISGFLSFKGRGEQPISRRISFPLRAGHRAAHLCAETTVYRYLDDLTAPKKWFTSHIDAVLHEFGAEHNIAREDIFMVIGALDAPEWGLFVSHRHPDGQAHFNVFSSPRNGEPWGVFSTDTAIPQEIGGPDYSETNTIKPRTASKVSKTRSNGDKWDTLLVARLRFKPDIAEPTSL
ncbi:hypothetical protein DL96DRAFT_1670173 [Flagelloscypha sp. PMI_526]|nr:hypothetical protein DL96DRAFT_1670173 [Flagelloscypha sp. PMI_526]